MGREANLLVLDALLEPAPLLGVGDVHVFGADMVAVGAPQDIEDLAQRCELKSERATDEDGAVIVGLGEAIGLGLELRMLAPRRKLQRVELGDEVAASTIGADQHACAKRVARGGKRLLLGDGVRGAGCEQAGYRSAGWLP